MKGYNGLQGALVSDRYKIGKALSKGANGHIYMVEDLIEKKKLVMKLQEEQEMATIEIGTMNKISQVIDANSKSNLSREIAYEATPRV